MKCLAQWQTWQTQLEQDLNRQPPTRSVIWATVTHLNCSHGWWKMFTCLIVSGLTPPYRLHFMCSLGLIAAHLVIRSIQRAASWLAVAWQPFPRPPNWLPVREVKSNKCWGSPEAVFYCPPFVSFIYTEWLPCWIRWMFLKTWRLRRHFCRLMEVGLGNKAAPTGFYARGRSREPDDLEQCAHLPSSVFISPPRIHLIATWLHAVW